LRGEGRGVRSQAELRHLGEIPGPRQNQRAFEVQLIAETFDAEPRVTATCKVQLSNRSYEHLVAQSWASPACN
jgi:hypothetical protein